MYVQPKRPLYLFLGGFLLCLIVGDLMNYYGYTFQAVDLMYCKHYLPWSSVQEMSPCEKSGDDLQESDFVVKELNYLKNNKYQSSYSERIMNGYPISDAYSSNKYSLTLFLTNFMPSTSSINFSVLGVALLSLAIGYRVGTILGLSNLGRNLFAFFMCPLYLMGSSESWAIGLISFELIILGALELYKKNNRLRGFVCVCSGAAFIYLSSIYQLMFYTVLNFFLFGLLYFSVNDKSKFVRCFVIIISCFISILFILNHFLITHFELLQVSNKIFNQLSFSELIPRKYFIFDPIGLTGENMVLAHRWFYKTLFGSGVSHFVKGVASPGPVFLFFALYGLALLFTKNKIFMCIIIFWGMYSLGYLQAFLSIAVGNPFKSETTIRASLLFFLLSLWPAIYSFSNFVEKGHRPTKFITNLTIIFFFYLVFTGLLMITYSYMKNIEQYKDIIFITVSCLFFLMASVFDRNNIFPRTVKGLYIASLVLPAISQMFLFVPPATMLPKKASLYYPTTKFQDKFKEYKIKRSALIETSSNKVDRIHPNLPMILGGAGITAYRNPLMRDYLDLYVYNKLIFEDLNKRGNYKNKFLDYKKSIDYIENRTIPFRHKKNHLTLPKATKNYFLLNGVDSIISNEDLDIVDPNWERIALENKLSLWKNTIKTPEYFFPRTVRYIQDPIDRLYYMFESGRWDPNNEVIIDNKNSLGEFETNSLRPMIKILKSTDGYRLIKYKKNQNKGIIVFPITYSKNWKALLTENAKELITLKANHAYLGVVLPKGNGEIKLIYNDKPSALNKIITCLGFVILIIIILFMRNSFLRKKE